ncbi:MAG: hypothetical protein Q7R95_05105 [bacterium]|nr:hypothetical protein [bacterium]
MQKHIIIIIPGLDDNEFNTNLIAKLWTKIYKVQVVPYFMYWKNKEDFDTKLQKLIQKIDEFYYQGFKISLVGTSAGGSVAINVFCKRKYKIHKVINVCGRLKKGKNVFPSLELASRSFHSFKESVLMCEKNINRLSKVDKQKILTIQPLYDEIVPISLITIEGVKNIRIFSIEHMLSIFLSMTIYSKMIIDFLL